MDKNCVYCLRRGVQAPNVLYSPGGPTLPMPLSSGRSAPTFRLRQQSCVEVQPWACTGLDETDVGAREPQGSSTAADDSELLHG